MRGEGLECGDFSEALMGFLDFFEVIQDDNSRCIEYGINSNQYQLLKDLYKQLSTYCDVTPVFPDNKEILADPRWRRIRDFAKRVYSELSASRA